jgi:VanZ family protein
LAFVFLTVWALFLWPSRSFGVVMMMLAFGAGIEAAQWTVGWRFAEWTDFAADALGVLGAWGLWKMPHLRGSN